MKYTPVIGLEVHVELKTNSKMFCGCSAEHFAVEPNTHTCPVCLGLPGALPVPNKKAIEWCVMIGMALNCKTPLFSKFDRKNYFYPDLSKGYQISQYDEPFAINGHIDLKSQILNPKSQINHNNQNTKTKTIRIRRVHMEEDTGKLQHATVNEKRVSLVDFNRSGVPLVEIVTEPDFESAEEVTEYLKKLQQIVRYLGVSDADMDKGQMRLEPNISLRPVSLRGGNDEAIFHNEIAASKILKGLPLVARNDNNLPPYKVEVKNINSFRFVDKAIAYEIKRQTEILDSGKTPEQVTMGWNEIKNATVPQRSKEEAHDYRYFPEPDIPPIRWNEKQLSTLRAQLPELPDAALDRFKTDYQLSEYDSEILTRDRELSSYFKECVRVGTTHMITPKQIANYIINKKVDTNTLLPAELIKTIVQNAQTTTMDEGELEKIIDEVVSENQKAVEDYKNGKENVIMFLVGMVMRKSKEKLDARMIKEKIQNTIKEVI